MNNTINKRTTALILVSFAATVVLASTAAATSLPFVLSWGSYGSGPGQFKSPNGIAVSSNGQVYTTEVDNQYRVQRFNGDGQFINLWGGLGDGPGQFDFPHDVAVDGSGNVYVADALNDRIQKFSANGSYITSWGSFGSGPGEFNLPYGVAVGPQGNVYVADRQNHRVQKFSGNGSYITSWGSYGSGSGQFNRPRGISVDAGGNVFVTDTGNHRVQKFSSSGTYLGQFGSYGSGSGQFNTPGDIAFGNGNIFVSDVGNHRIQEFTSSFSYVDQLGSFGFGEGLFVSPWGIEVSSDGYLYVVDGGNARIQKFGPMGTGGGGDDNTLAGTNVVVNLESVMEITFDRVTSSGNTVLAISTAGTPLPSGFVAIPSSSPEEYNVNTTASYVGGLDVAIDYDPSGVRGSESNLKVFQLNDSVSPAFWVDITTTVRTGPNIIEGRSAFLSRYVVAEPTSVTGVEDDIRAGITSLHPAVPNPFHRSTRIAFTLAETGPVRLLIFDVQGRLVRTLVDETRGPGAHNATWDGRGDGGGPASPGVYFYRLEAAGFTKTMRVVMVQ